MAPVCLCADLRNRHYVLSGGQKKNSSCSFRTVASLALWIWYSAVVQEAQKDMKSFVFEGKKNDADIQGPTPVETSSPRRKRKRAGRPKGPQPRALFQNEDDEDHPEESDGEVSEEEAEEGGFDKPREHSPALSVIEDEDLFRGRFSMKPPPPTPKRTPRKKRAKSSSKIPRKDSNESLLRTTPSKSVEAAEDVVVLSKAVDQQLLNVFPPGMNPFLALIRCSCCLLLFGICSLRFDLRIMLNMLIGEELTDYETALTTFTSLRGSFVADNSD